MRCGGGRGSGLWWRSAHDPLAPRSPQRSDAGQSMSQQQLLSFVDRVWEDSILPQLVDYIRIPNKSPAFDKQWQQAGHMQRAVDLIAGWCKAQQIEGLTVEV